MTLREIRRFRATLRTFERITHAQLKQCCGGVTLAQCLVLLEVDESRRPTMGQLASRLRLDNSTLSRTVDGLVGSGMLERLRDDRDRRVVWIRLTPRGAKLCRSIHGENDAHCRAVFAKIPVARRAGVVGAFEVLVQAFLDREAEAGPGGCRQPVASTPRSSARRRSRLRASGR